MKLVQPDGTHCIGINYEEERPSILEVLPNRSKFNNEYDNPIIKYSNRKLYIG